MSAAPPGAAPRWSGRRGLVLLFVLTLPLVTPKIRGADEIEYFSYLRSLVFDRDLEFGNEYERFYAADPQGLAGFKATFLERLETDTGRHINFAPLGSALLWSPFYLLAHAGVLAARALGAHVAADGFSFPYVAAVCYASVFYGLAGLLLVHDTLRGRGCVPEPAATLAVAGLWLATPLLYYMTLAPAFSHAPAVFAVALLLWLSLRAAARPDASGWEWAAVGASGGLAALVREQDGLFLIVPAGLLLHRAITGGAGGASLARGVAMGMAAGAASSAAPARAVVVTGARLNYSFGLNGTLTVPATICADSAASFGCAALILAVTSAGPCFRTRSPGPEPHIRTSSSVGSFSNASRAPSCLPFAQSPQKMAPNLPTSGSPSPGSPPITLRYPAPSPGPLPISA